MCTGLLILTIQKCAVVDVIDKVADTGLFSLSLDGCALLKRKWLGEDFSSCKTHLKKLGKKKHFER